MYFNDENNKTNIDEEFDNNNKFNFSKKNLIIVGLVMIILLVIVIYLMIPKESPIEYYLVLNGSEDVVIYQDMEYVDMGYRAYDNKGQEYNQDVVVEGNVSSAVAGEYEIKYSYNGIEKRRMVTVLSKSTQLTFLVLLGEKTMYLKLGEVYEEPGYKVIDSYDENLSDQVKVTGSVNVNESGTYKLLYSVTNHLGVEFVEERTIIVLGTDVSISYSPDEYTKDKVVVNIGVVDNYFDYVIFPDNTKSYERYSKYEVFENGIYKFLVYSKNGTYQEKEIEIWHIDREEPTGSCSGYYQNGNSYVTVIANDNMTGVNKYVVNNQSFMKSSFVLNGELSTVAITLYDGVGNSKNISCQLTNKNPVVVKPASSSNSSSNGNIVMCNDNRIYEGTKYNLTTSQKEKLAAMVYNEGGYNYIGMKAVASHMANLYEKEKFKKPSMTDSLYEYIHDNKWYSWGTRNSEYDGSSSYMRQALQAVEEVIIGGKRVLPLYIDEFDWFPNDVKNTMDKSKYIQGETIYTNVYSDTEIIFWCFNLNSKGTTGNIFGYIKNEVKYREYVENK